MHKRVVFFDEGKGLGKRLLGGKGAGLVEMTMLGLPVPPGFTITTEVCKAFYANGRELPDGLMDEVRQAIHRLEQLTGKGFGSSSNPLLVSVRSGAAISMPGMMDTILNLGLNDDTARALMARTGNSRFVWDAYRRFVQMFGKIVLGIDDKLFSTALEEMKRSRGVMHDNELDAEALKQLTYEFKAICRRHGKEFPSDPYEQLELAIKAVFNSWMSERAVEYRKYYKITPDIADGTAVNVVTMVFGNMDERSATGVVFTRSPENGEKRLYGDFLVNAQGEDVVAGIRTPEPIENLARVMPDTYRQLVEICDRLERHYREPQDVEFTIESGRLYILQTRAAKMNAIASVKCSVDMVKEGIISREEALLRVNADDLEQVLHRRVDPKAGVKPIATGIGASPGAASGKVILDTKRAIEYASNGEQIILVREETKPEDVPAFFKAVGILTSKGGKTSHAAVVARGMGKPCIVGCSSIVIDEEHRRFTVDGVAVKEYDTITIDGATGRVYLGSVPMVEPELSGELRELLSWAEGVKRLGVRANADTPEAASMARAYGAKGIGLCRTERMFNSSDRLPIFVRMIMARSREERMSALEELMPMLKSDAKSILRVMEGYPVTIRLLDPPLHEFLPRLEDLMRAAYEGKDAGAQVMLQRVRELAEVNPMMGQRGVRLGIVYPEIYEYQMRAILEAAAELIKEGVEAEPQIMVPQVGIREELEAIRQVFLRVKGEVEGKYGTMLDVKFGTMIEVVRACMTADSIASVAEFFSFGTNDLTQAVFSFSREDVEGKFLPLYIERGVLKSNPFQTLDRDGVGRVMRIAVEHGRASNPRLEIGICGEHGGDPKSIEFCDIIGLDYVSASPHRIPIAILAAAQSAIRLRKS
ncbi:MAG: pyruvate, phosphate dikinase [Candidatus Nitrosocaldus sp.]|nr:pyruvate, phosphate dikinase [Candidatus Nitrosocaldus sp.]MDW8000094.1 pyruvate, phosphate dikinase [Candidatus Nitrosocaldus sp.]